MNTVNSPIYSLPQLCFVDDDRDDRYIVMDVLKDQPACNALFFSDGGQLMAYLEKTVSLPTLLILDHRLPGCEGDELLHRLKQDPRFSAIPVMILSSFLTAAKKTALLEAGAWMVADKPNHIKAYEELLAQVIAFARAA